MFNLTTLINEINYYGSSHRLGEADRRLEECKEELNTAAFNEALFLPADYLMQGLKFRRALPLDLARIHTGFHRVRKLVRFFRIQYSKTP